MKSVGPSPSAPADSSNIGFAGSKSNLKAFLDPIDGFAERRIDGYAGNGDPIRRHSQHPQIRLGFVNRHEVTMKGARQPHGVKIEVGHDDGKLGSAIVPSRSGGK